MNIVTVWSGGFEKYTTMLRKMIRDTTGKKLIVLGEDVQLKTEWRGWCSKIEIFSPAFQKYRPCFYLDLDTYVLKDISQFLVEPERLTLIRDFNCPERGNSGLMSIPKDVHGIFERYNGEMADGNYLNTFPHDYLQDRHPGEIKSYKVDKCQDEKPDCSIMCFHGKPKPHQTTGWARDVWQMNTNS